jgi:RimJ/RimL family protein N-acetyltransferase
MKALPTLRTPRLILRPWLGRDLDAFAELNADPQVMQHLLQLLDREASDSVAERIGAHFARYGFGLWAMEVPGVADFVGFDQLNLDAIVSFTVPANDRSVRVMERIGMKRVIGGDFDHPNLAQGHPLRRHVLYRLTRTDWLASRGESHHR